LKPEPTHTIDARYYDGQHSSAAPLRIIFQQNGELHCTTETLEFTVDIRSVRVSQRIGNTPRFIYLDNNAKIETHCNDELDSFLQIYKNDGRISLVHRIENSLKYAGVAVVIAAVFVWGSVQYGIPAVATTIAAALPIEASAKLGEGTLAVLDKSVFKPSELSEQRKQQLTDLFNGVTSQTENPQQYQLLFRRSPRLGANAFALPSGSVIITDALVKLAKTDEELLGVLAHEVGHVVHKHSLRSVIADSGVVLLITMVTGDVSSISSLAAAIPTLLIDASYSRTFETESDLYARSYLKSQGVNISHFTAMLERLQAHHTQGSHDEDTQSQLSSYFSSHPITKDRIQRLAEY